MKRLAPLSFLCAFAITACEPSAPSPGMLTIVGGGLSADNAPIWTAFIESAKPIGPIVIIPAASGYPADSGRQARNDMITHGARPENIVIAPLAVMDDPTTKDEDESLWRDNATNLEIAETLRGAGAIWFTGGDQRRIVDLLNDTPALTAIRQAYRSGAGIGGTSAGAAIMSDPMISGGFRDGAESEPLTLQQGLGFLPGTIVDQHFSERGRLWRLQEALEAHPNQIGIGIDEDTALHGPAHAMVVIGRGQVYTVRRSGVLSVGDGKTLTISEAQP